MSQVEYFNTDQRSWWERLVGSLTSRPEGDMGYQLPSDSLFANTWNGGSGTVADVPDQVKAQIREEAVLSTFHRLEASLRLLLYATTPEKEPPTAEQLHQILNVWRYELEHRVNLTPDTYCGAVQRYEQNMESAYAIDGRCVPGDLLRIRVPCWRMFDRVVIRGEAEIIEESPLDAPAALGIPITTYNPDRLAEPVAVTAQPQSSVAVTEPTVGLPAHSIGEMQAAAADVAA